MAEQVHPRQRMINLMYLVFIAMLAIQIDQEVLRSFNDTKDSLQSTRLLTQQKNKIFEQTLAAKAQNSPDTFSQPFANYQKLKALVDALVTEVSTDITEINRGAGLNITGAEEEIDFNVLNNTESSTRYFFDGGNENTPSKQAQSLVKKMGDLRALVSKMLPKNDQTKPLLDRVEQSMATEFNTPNKKKNNKNWTQYKFYNQPLVAALSNLEVIANEARNIQSDALSYMLQEKVDADIKFNAYQAIVAGPTVVLQGDKQEIKVVIGTYAKDVEGLQITGVDRQESGQGFKSLNTASVGQQTIRGEIRFKDANGKEVVLPYTHNYNVIAGAQEVKLQSGALVSATKMNVLYRGIANPVSGSILGADNSAVNLSASGGARVAGGRGSWTVTPAGGNEVTLTISGRDPKGRVISESFKFRVKNVPPPIAQIRGSAVTSMPASSVKNQHVSVDMPDFEFQVGFTVNSFKLSVPGRPAMTIQGNSLGSAGSALNNLRAGDVVYVFDVKATATGIGQGSVTSKSAAVINVQ